MIRTLGVIILLITLNVFRGTAMEISIIESRSYLQEHTMDLQWQTIIQDSTQHRVNIHPLSFLNTRTFYPQTNLLIISSGLITLSPLQTDNILEFVKQGGHLYLQTEYDTTLASNQLFKQLVAALDGQFEWKGSSAGNLVDININTCRTRDLSMSYFWYGAYGIGDCTIDYFLESQGKYYGMRFKSFNRRYGSIITCSDQDWIRTASNKSLMVDIINCFEIAKHWVRVDNIPPSLTVSPILDSVSCDANNEPEILVNDNCKAINILYTEEANYDCPYQVIKIWKAIDPSNNADYHRDTVIMIDTVAPDFLNAVGALDRTVICGDEALLQQALSLTPRILDNCAPEEELQNNSTLIDTSTIFTCVNKIAIQKRFRHWTYSDPCGNSRTYTQIITIKDDSAPYFLESPNALDYIVCDATSLNDALKLAPTIKTICQATEYLQNIYKDTLLTLPSGQDVRRRYWRYEDTCTGKAANYIQNIYFQAGSLATVLNCNDINLVADLSCDNIFVEWDETAVIQSTNQITNWSQTNGLLNGSTFPIGVNSIEYLMEDACGDTASCTFNVTVISAVDTLSNNCNSDIYEPNNTILTARTLPTLGTGVVFLDQAYICPKGDDDWYKLEVLPNSPNITIRLNELPLNYNLYLYDNNNVLLDSSNNACNNSELLINTLQAGTYFIKVAGNNWHHPNNSYVLSVQMRTIIHPTTNNNSLQLSSRSSNRQANEDEKLSIQITPNPSQTYIQIFTNGVSPSALIELLDNNGRILKQASTVDGVLIWETKSLAEGIYWIRLKNGKNLLTDKFSVVR